MSLILSQVQNWFALSVSYMQYAMYMQYMQFPNLADVWIFKLSLPSPLAHAIAIPAFATWKWSLQFRIELHDQTCSFHFKVRYLIGSNNNQTVNSGM